MPKFLSYPKVISGLTQCVDSGPSCVKAAPTPNKDRLFHKEEEGKRESSNRMGDARGYFKVPRLQGAPEGLWPEAMSHWLEALSLQASLGLPGCCSRP